MTNLNYGEMPQVIELYKSYCESNNISFKIDDMVKSYDETTLFCPAGMQQFKEKFKNPDNTTVANSQSCIRLQDLEEIGDGSHLLYFNMLGLFSFGEMTMQQTIHFWMRFFNDILKVSIDYVTIHPDKYDSWRYFYSDYPGLEIRYDSECIWSDGELGGYCTEFYKNEIEIGNIVNTSGQLIDVGFGLERIESILGNPVKSSTENLKETIYKIIESGYKPGNQKQEYILRKLLRQLHKSGETIEHQFFSDEVERQSKIASRYLKIKDKHPDKTKEWWYDTHGIDLSLL
jgi:alanyl-tRNA synthetase